MISAIVSWAWTTAALAGLVVNLYAVADAKVDRYYAQTHIHKGTRSLVANSNIRRERVRVIIQIFFAAAGVLSIVMPATEALQGTRSLIGLVMILASLLTVYNSIADRLDRKKLLALIDEQEEHRRRNQEQRDLAAKAMKEANEDYQDRTEGALHRLEEAGKQVATDLAGSQGRADATQGEPGEAADAASRSKKEDE